MSILDYFTTQSSLPDSRGSLSQSLPSSAIAAANREVQRVIQEKRSKRRGPYRKYTSQEKAEIGGYAKKHSIMIKCKENEWQTHNYEQANMYPLLPLGDNYNTDVKNVSSPLGLKAHVNDKYLWAHLVSLKLYKTTAQERVTCSNRYYIYAQIQCKIPSDSKTTDIMEKFDLLARICQEIDEKKLFHCKQLWPVWKGKPKWWI